MILGLNEIIEAQHLKEKKSWLVIAKERVREKLLPRLLGEDCVGNKGGDCLSPCVKESVLTLNKGTTRLHQIIDNKAMTTRHIALFDSHLATICARTNLRKEISALISLIN